MLLTRRQFLMTSAVAPFATASMADATTLSKRPRLDLIIKGEDQTTRSTYTLSEATYGLTLLETLQEHQERNGLNFDLRMAYDAAWNDQVTGATIETGCLVGAFGLASYSLNSYEPDLPAGRDKEWWLCLGPRYMVTDVGQIAPLPVNRLKSREFGLQRDDEEDPTLHPSIDSLLVEEQLIYIPTELRHKRRIMRRYGDRLVAPQYLLFYGTQRQLFR